MYRLRHIAHKGFDVGHGGGAVLGKKFDDGTADDGTITDFGHGGGLLRGGNAKADGAGQAGILADQLHHGGNIRLDLAAGTGNAKGGNDVDKAAGLFCNHGNALLRGGGNQADEIQPILAAQAVKLFFFLIRHIGKDQAVHADLGGSGNELFAALINDKEYHTANGKIVAPRYNVNLTLQNSVTFINVLAGLFDNNGDGFDFLIGMDIISQGNLAVTNSNGVKLISFEYPTHGTIDFTSMQ